VLSHGRPGNGWLAAVRDLVGERAVDIVLDPVGSDRMTDSLRSLAPEGRLLVLGFAGGEIPVVKVNRLLLGNTGVLGVASREFFERHPALVAELWGQLLALRQSGALADPPVEAYPFTDARGALRAISERRARGKVVLSRTGRAGSGRGGAKLRFWAGIPVNRARPGGSASGMRQPPGQQCPQQPSSRLHDDIEHRRVPSVEEELPGCQRHRERRREQGRGDGPHGWPSSQDDQEAERNERQHVKEGR
jgi:hypothetical protein